MAAIRQNFGIVLLYSYYQNFQRGENGGRPAVVTAMDEPSICSKRSTHFLTYAYPKAGLRAGFLAEVSCISRIPEVISRISSVS